MKRFFRLSAAFRFTTKFIPHVFIAVIGLGLFTAASLPYWPLLRSSWKQAEANTSIFTNPDIGTLALAPWPNIGGCGAGGGGAAAGAGKWMGRGVRGGIIDAEVLGNKTLGGDYLYSSTQLGLTFHVPSLPAWTAGLSLAWKSNSFEYEGYKTASNPVSRLQRQTGGIGDLGLSVNRLFGEENEHSLGFSFSLPTGQHDIKRLHRKSQAGDDIRWMSPFVQPGSGLYTTGLSYEFTKDKDWGILVYGSSYSASFARDNWKCRDGNNLAVNDKVRYCQDASPSALTFNPFDLQHQEWFADPQSWLESEGAPGTGATGADNVSLFAYVGHKEESSTQSAGLTLDVPLSPTYAWEYGPQPDNKVSTRIRTYDVMLKLSLGVEITHPSFPVFLSLGVPWALNEVWDRGRLVEPKNYIGTLGVKGTFF